ncbi:formate hydrogenlyase maturation HycH family protein [Telmatospirillum sp.]|uniref:formate hydrogenlyase maturation HycH family protein n=1 Tax=Telmatospirillum sp. TaxID=2079197 RepID=UPI00283E981A|nr:formate hydrogenlyase maturation HycH family protein [Telmatospirillum sp.]MDR3438353.1 formate hydrogenlyase maturation HycH family protein [Telmatospirillum sp.]
MTGDVVFYQLNAKFLERAEDVPETSKQVVYYSLAIGHHIGVFDCFKPVLRCNGSLYDEVLASLPDDGEAHRKLAGLLRFGEITVDRSHTALLRQAFVAARPTAPADVQSWFGDFDKSLDAIEQEPAIYLMGRRLS